MTPDERIARLERILKWLLSILPMPPLWTGSEGAEDLESLLTDTKPVEPRDHE